MSVWIQLSRFTAPGCFGLKYTVVDPSAFGISLNHKFTWTWSRVPGEVK